MTAITQIRTPSVLFLSDLNTTVNHEPRVLDTRLGEVLGMARPRDIRQLIERNSAELERYGQVCGAVPQTAGNKGGRPGKAYYLNEGQVLCLSALSDAPNAPEARHALITVYMEYRRGLLGAPALPPPSTEPPFCTGCAARRQWDQGERRHLALADGPLTGDELLVVLGWRAQLRRTEVAIRKQVVAEASAAVRAILTGDVK